MVSVHGFQAQEEIRWWKGMVRENTSIHGTQEAES